MALDVKHLSSLRAEARLFGLGTDTIGSCLSEETWRSEKLVQHVVPRLSLVASFNAQDCVNVLAGQKTLSHGKDPAQR